MIIKRAEQQQKQQIKNKQIKYRKNHAAIKGGKRFCSKCHDSRNP